MRVKAARLYEYKFAVAVVILFSIALLLRQQLSYTPPNILRDMLTLSLGVLYEALPFVFLGSLLSAFIQTFFSGATILRFLPKNEYARRATLSVSGSVLPVCECGNVPLARGLMVQGLKPQDVMTFLLAAPIINPVTIATTLQAFGGTPQVAIYRVVAAFFIANLIGWIIAGYRSKKILTPTFESQCHTTLQKTHAHKHSLVSKIQSLAIKFRHELETLLPALIFGSLVAGFIQTAIPRSVLLSVSSEPVIAIIALIVLAFVVSICANVDAFFALSLSGIFPMSAIVAFLVFGPMIDIKMLSLLRTTYTKQTLALVSGLVFLCSLMTGLVVHYAL